MIGCGRAGVAEICDISRANVADGLCVPAVHGLSSLGGHGKHQQNQERDLHRWVKGLHSMTLEPIQVPMLLNASWISKQTFQVDPEMFIPQGQCLGFLVYYNDINAGRGHHTQNKREQFI